MTDNPGLKVEITELEGKRRAAVLRVEGEVDMSTVDRLTGGFKRLAERGVINVIVDAQEVSFMDSTGLHSLVAGKERIHQAGSQIVLITSPKVRRLLELVFPGHLYAKRVDTMDQALAALDE